jgi:hypothetical protein
MEYVPAIFNAAIMAKPSTKSNVPEFCGKKLQFPKIY